MIMAHTPPISPVVEKIRPRSAMIRPGPRSNSRISMIGGKTSSRASDEEAKTTVQVAVRIRPPLNPTDPGFDLIPQRFQKSMVHVTSPTAVAIDAPQGRKLFIFDRVFSEEISQEGIWDYVSTSVDSFLQGYNVSVMAYGQSGAGKSFTMGTSGPREQDNQDLMGIIPRAANALFSKLAPSIPNFTRTNSGMRAPNRYSMSSIPSNTPIKTAVNDRSWQLRATYVEIYNEQLRDLLLPESTPMNERQTVTIREDTKGRIILTGLRQVDIDSAEDLLEALNLGSTIRQTDATAINARSSRSHAVFSLNLVQRKTKAEVKSFKDKRMSMPADAFSESVTVDSKLHFVDLAGSERLKNTQASGERAKEGISINAGLASLGKVISQLSSRHAGSHVSYRDSKLTRLLQDSLGGNAITYLIACVTPAEFHLSETLNTVQYAQRARAIQTKPQIQQIDDGDKQAIIDRLRAEIQFLRDQIRSAENGTKSDSQGRSQRSNDREVELQNRLLDLEENYSTLSQRHAKLMSGMTQDRQQNGEDMALPNGTGHTDAIDRIKRSTSFADAVEGVVLEYEKTIQSLESSLSKTRSNLSANESALLEKETRCAYMETMNQQLQSRVQKLISRETSNEQYIHDMESKLDGVVGGEERHTTMLSELRKEISRLRESENTSEEYIAGLEDKLAEAVNNSDLLHREVSRLEEALERQRNFNRMDDLLQDLDRGRSKTNESPTQQNGHALPPIKTIIAPKYDMLEEAMATPIPEEDSDDELDATSRPRQDSQRLQSLTKQNQAQSKFLSEKLEMVNQELFDLRVDHEATIGDYDLLSAKYEEALRTLAALQDSIDDQRRTAPSPLHFLSEEGANDGQRDGKQSSSRSLSLELSSLGQSTEVTELTESGYIHPAHFQHNSESTSREIEKAGDIDQAKLLSRQSAEYAALQERYEILHEQHLDTLDLVEELKTEVQKVKHSHKNSGSNNNLIRRKSTQNLLSVDRAHRSIASLENIASDSFAENPDLKDSFNLSLSNITHELHQRAERVQELESDLANTKKELDTKMTIISGLARERTSMAAATSPVEMSMLSTMQDQIVELERQLASFHQDSGTREQELMEEISSLRKHLDGQKAVSEPSLDMPGAYLTTPMEGQKSFSNDEISRTTELQEQIAHWQKKHQTVTETLQESEKRLLATISELEQTLNSVEANRKAKASELDSLINSNAAAAAAFELERVKHEESVQYYKKEIQARATTIGTQASRLVTMEKDLNRALSEIQQHHELGQVTVKSLDDHRDHIEALERQLAEHQAIIKTHKDELVTLQSNHEAEIAARRDSTLRGVEGDTEMKITDLTKKHAEQTNELTAKIQDLQSLVRSKDTEIAQHKDVANEGSSVIQTLQQENKTHSRTASEALNEIKDTKQKLQSAEEARELAEANLAQAQARVEELQWTKQELNNELEEVRLREQRASRLVEELEGQLHSTFEEGRNTSSRLSHLQTVRDQDLVDARTALIKAQEEATSLRNRIELLENGRDRGSPISPLDSPNPERANSLTSQFRKNNVTSLPSPPPTQPLPPIPTNPRDSRTNGGTSPSGQRISQQIQSVQQIEEHNARLRTMEKHLKAEKQLTQTLEEALSDLELQVNKSKKELEVWKTKAWQYENELGAMQKERQVNRQSLQQVEEAKIKQREAEIARQHLEERMAALNKKKKKGGLNCF